MCTASDCGTFSFDSPGAALRAAGAALDYLNSPGAGLLDGPASGEVLVALTEIQAKVTAAHAGVLRRFDAADGHDADGYGSSSAWLAAKAGDDPGGGQGGGRADAPARSAAAAGGGAGGGAGQ